MTTSHRVLVALASALSLVTPALGQTYKSRIEHPIVRYKMSARFDPATRTVKGHYVLSWWNHTEDSIPDLYFHLYWNAFKNADSTFLRESAVSRRGRGLEGWKAESEAANNIPHMTRTARLPFFMKRGSATSAEMAAYRANPVLRVEDIPRISPPAA